MALKQNGRQLHSLPLRHRGGATLSMEYADSNKSDLRNIYMGWAQISQSAAVPNGGLESVAWILPQKGGGISAYKGIDGITVVSGSLAAGRNIAASNTGTSTFTSVMQLVVSAIASLTGSGTIVANAVVKLNAAAGLSGSASVSGLREALGNVLSNMSGSVSVTVSSYATGTLSSDITPFSELSPQNLASAVWESLSADYVQSGTMGKKLNDAGGSVSPEDIADAVWDELLGDHVTIGTTGKAVQDIKTNAGLIPAAL